MGGHLILFQVRHPAIPRPGLVCAPYSPRFCRRQSRDASSFPIQLIFVECDNSSFAARVAPARGEPAGAHLHEPPTSRRLVSSPFFLSLLLMRCTFSPLLPSACLMSPRPYPRSVPCRERSLVSQQLESFELYLTEKIAMVVRDHNRIVCTPNKQYNTAGDEYDHEERMVELTVGQLQLRCDVTPSPSYPPPPLPLIPSCPPPPHILLPPGLLAPPLQQAAH